MEEERKVFIEQDKTKDERREMLIKSASSPDMKKIGDMELLELVDTLSANVAFVQGVIDLMYGTSQSDFGSLDDINDLGSVLTEANDRLNIVRALNQEIWEKAKDSNYQTIKAKAI